MKAPFPATIAPNGAEGVHQVVVRNAARKAMKMANVGRVRDGIADFALRVQSLKRCVRAALGVAALALAGVSHAAGLFLPVGPAGTAVDVAPMPKSTSARRSPVVVPGAWERRVRIARQELTAAREDVDHAGAGRLLLNVRDGVRLNVIVERTAPTKWGYSLSGGVAGGGFMTLVVHEEVVAGSIWTPRASYDIIPVGGGVHMLRDVTNLPIQCGAMHGMPPPSQPEYASDGAVADVDDGSVVDILFVYTPWAEEILVSWGLTEFDPPWVTDLSPDSLFKATGDLWVSFVNNMFERSGALFSVNLVGIEKLEDFDVGRCDENGERCPNEGFAAWSYPQTRALRDRFGADLVHAIVGCCFGVANTDGYGYFTIMDGTAVFVHEIGHNFGIAHERGEINSGTRAYEHGFTADTNSCRNTFMSYGTACISRTRGFIPFYASPWRYGGNGNPMGVTRFSKERGLRGPADAVLTLNRNRHRVANLRPSITGGSER